MFHLGLLSRFAQRSIKMISFLLLVFLAPWGFISGTYLAHDRAIAIGDETRLHRYIQATEPRRVDFEAEPRSRLLLRLALILLQNDDAAYEYLSQEEWALRLMRSNPQLAACFQGVKERL